MARFLITRNVLKKKNPTLEQSGHFLFAACFSLHLQKASNKKNRLSKSYFPLCEELCIAFLVQLSLQSTCFQKNVALDGKIHERAPGCLVWWYSGLEGIPPQLPKLFVN